MDEMNDYTNTRILYVPFPVFHEFPVHPVVPGILIADSADRDGIERVNIRSGTGKEHGRMAGDDELGMSRPAHLGEHCEEFELTFRRKRRFRRRKMLSGSGIPGFWSPEKRAC